MSDQVSAESIGVPDEVSKSTCCIGSGFFFLVSKKFDQEWNTWLQVLVKNIVVESSITNSEASELPGVSVWVLAAFNSSRNETKLEQLLVEEASVTTEVSNQVADLGSDGSVVVNDQLFQVFVDVSLMDVLVEIL